MRPLILLGILRGSASSLDKLLWWSQGIDSLGDGHLLLAEICTNGSDDTRESVVTTVCLKVRIV